MPSLDRAVALAQVDQVAEAVAEHLNLDVARAGDQSFQDQGVVAERRAGLTAGGSQRLGQLGQRRHLSHAATTAAAAAFTISGTPMRSASRVSVASS